MNLHLLTNNIADIYVGIMCICKFSIDSIISESNFQHSMLGFNKENIVLLNKKCQGILPTNMLASLVNLNSFILYIYV